ncbi:hypothetical protein F4818DRAFT_403624 [Hypoxylon cercidicola]|nr:hypothetical protein F4818DRAFT_403624 [Hypoxylon cercidicola]
MTSTSRKGVPTANLVQFPDASVSSFDHGRFLRELGGKRTGPAAFRFFGGGSVLYPGRYFVSTEVIPCAALLLLRFDLKPVGGTPEGYTRDIVYADVQG